MVTIEDSLCLIQTDDAHHTTGFVIGYFKEYDDISIYYLEEIEKRVLEHGAKHIELTSVNDEHHLHFYTEFGMYAAANLKIMGKHYEA